MSLAFPMTAGEANQLIQNIITRTRPVSNAELYQALNYGIAKAVRAISASRPQYFASWVEPFTIGGGVTEYDVSSFSPSLFRPWRLVCNGNQGQSSVVLFKYASITTQEFEDAEVSTSGAVANNLLYDVLDGLLPGAVVYAAVAMNAGANAIPLSAADFAAVKLGNFVVVANFGNAVTKPGWDSGWAFDDYTATVVGLQTGGPTGQEMIVEPPLPQAFPTTQPIQLMRRRVIKIVPALQQTYTGRLWYVYTPTRLRQDGDPLPIGLADRHIDMVVAYAVGLLKRAVDDSMENRWALEATEMRSELMQDTEPVSGQNSEALGSALDWIGY
jgi:hypothetical protein